MGWAAQYMIKLRAGETVQFRPRGNSMTPRIESGQLCTVEPVKDLSAVEPGDVLLCRVNGSDYLRLVKAKSGDRVQIGNNHGRVNGWIGLSGVFGRLTKVE